MTDVESYVKLKRIISYFIDENNLSADELDKAWVLAFRALVLLNQQIAAEPITFRLPVNANKTVNFPSNGLSWSKIGVMDEGGRVSTLKINSALTTFRDNNPNRLSRLTPDINSGLSDLCNSPNFFNYGYNGQYQVLFGVGGGLIQYGECKVDDVNRVVILPPDFRFDSILFECAISPEKNNDYEIQTVLQEAVIAFLNWKYKLGDRALFYAAAVEGRRALPKKKFTLQHAAQVIRENSGQFLKA